MPRPHKWEDPTAETRAFEDRVDALLRNLETDGGRRTLAQFRHIRSEMRQIVRSPHFPRISSNVRRLYWGVLGIFMQTYRAMEIADAERNIEQLEHGRNVAMDRLARIGRAQARLAAGQADQRDTELLDRNVRDHLAERYQSDIFRIDGAIETWRQGIISYEREIVHAHERFTAFPGRT
nr:hypothetical protein CFP56_19609 [Quercus suber]